VYVPHFKTMWQLQDDWSWYTRLSGSKHCLPFSPNMLCCQVKTSSNFKVVYISNLLKMLLKEQHIYVKFYYKLRKTAK